MLNDLKISLKKPEGGFVSQDTLDYGKTQRIQAITDDMLEENKNNNKSSKHKKESKIKAFFKKYPKLKYVIIALAFIVIFVAAFFITKSAMDAGAIKDIEAPNLVGLTEDEVKEALKEKACFAPIHLNNQLASSVAKAALDKAMQKEFDDYDTLNPMYLKKSQAERMLEDDGKSSN